MLNLYDTEQPIVGKISRLEFLRPVQISHLAPEEMTTTKTIDKCAEAVAQGFAFCIKFDDPTLALTDYIDLLKIARALSDAEITEVGRQITAKLAQLQSKANYQPKHAHKDLPPNHFFSDARQ
jgi:hypothetical protein